jgi:hypothetical protein
MVNPSEVKVRVFEDNAYLTKRRIKKGNKNISHARGYSTYANKIPKKKNARNTGRKAIYIFRLLIVNMSGLSCMMCSTNEFISTLLQAEMVSSTEVIGDMQ